MRNKLKTSAHDTDKTRQNPFCTLLSALRVRNLGTDLWDKPTLLFNSWKDFAAAANFIPGSNKDFKSKLEAAGYRYHRTGPRGRHYEGIKAKPNHSY